MSEVQPDLNLNNRQVITGKTVLCGIIGDPIAHTMSPAMHNTVYETLHLDYLYVPFRVTKEQLPDAIRGMRALNMRGVNVTIPHKEAVLTMLDQVDERAGKIGAVNTIVNTNGILSGFNTDAEGFMRTLVEKDIRIPGKRILIIGAGGAAKAIAFVLAEHKARITIINRSQEKAAALAKQLKDQLQADAAAYSLEESNLREAAASVEMIVNTTSIGMGTADTPIPARYLRKNLLVYDIVYNPLRTQLLREAELKGALTICGAEMLAWQGAIAFEKWTGCKAPVEIMKNTIYNKLT